MTIRPVKEGIVFTGKVYFQNLNKTELDQLIFVLNAGDEAPLCEKNHGYKLGGAKPLGLGSIAISVDEVMLRKIVKNTETRSVERREIAYQGYESPRFEADILENFLKMADFHAVAGKTVSYPFTEKKDKDGLEVIFDWFVHNHVKIKQGVYDPKGMPNSRTQMAFAEYLEAMEPEVQSTRKQMSGKKTGMSAGESSHRTETKASVGRKQQEPEPTGEIPFLKGKNYRAVVKKCTYQNVILSVDGKEGCIFYKNLPGAKAGELNQLFYKGQSINVQYIGPTTCRWGICHNFEWLK